MNWIGEKTGKLLADYLNEPSGKYEAWSTARPDILARCLQKDDVLLIDGHLRVNVAIKYITQSTWSHAALYVGDALPTPQPGGEANVLIEADLNDGVVAVPVRFRRRLLALGSGDPTQAICSTLIAQAFQLVAYPILPVIKSETVAGSHYTRDCLHIRHHSLFAPRDFDVSPYFEIIKPTITEGFDYRALNWVSDRPEHRPLNPTAVAQ